MFRKLLISTCIVLAAASAAWAQTPKVEITGLIGYTLADGVNGDPIKAANGQTYDSGRAAGFDQLRSLLRFFVTPSAEIGFLWRRQATKMDVSGTAQSTVGDWNIDGYHGYGAYYFGDPEAKVHPVHHVRPGRDPLWQRVLQEGGRFCGQHAERHPVLGDRGRRW